MIGIAHFQLVYFLKYIFTVSVRSKTENRNYIFKYMQHNFFQAESNPIESLLWDYKFVSYASDCLNIFWVSWICFQFLTQAAY